MASFHALRTVLFWLHLATGAAAGAVIFVMCVTGVALTFEKQLLEWSDGASRSVPLPAEARPLPPETLLAAAIGAEPGAAPTGIAARAERHAAVTVSFDGGRTLLVDSYTGQSLGEPSPRLRSFFRTMTNWHRWLAMEGVSRGTGRAATGAANLGFLFLVLSGLYLWVPRAWTRLQFVQVLWLRRGLTGKPRDFNWHNVVGLWLAVPLAVVIAGAVPISYPWANHLVYRLAGETPPAPAVRAAGQPSREGLDRQRPRRDHTGLDAAWAAAQAAVPAWRTMSARLGAAPGAPFVITLDEGSSGQPQWRTTLTIDPRSAAIVKTETFADLSPGRRARTWLRFAHTGEIYGLPGQAVAGVASAGGALLVYTGLALAVRRGWAWLRRRAPRSEARRAA